MKDNIKKFIKVIYEIKMTEEERESIKLRITTLAKLNPTKKASPFYIPSPYFSKFHFKMSTKLVGFVLLFFVLGISGVTYASASSLPGDLLYGIKIARENLEEKFVSTPQERIALKQKRIDTRFNEVETLIKEKKITPQNRSVADTKIKEDTAAIGTDIEKINVDNPQAAMDAKITLNASIQEHQEKIDSLIKQNDDADININDSGVDIIGSNETDVDGEEGTVIDPNINTNDNISNTNLDKNSSATSSTIDNPTDSSTIQNIKVTPESNTSATTSSTSTTNNINKNNSTSKKTN